jgi:hypothetical protein
MKGKKGQTDNYPVGVKLGHVSNGKSDFRRKRM